MGYLFSHWASDPSPEFLVLYHPECNYWDGLAPGATPAATWQQFTL